MAQPFFRLLKEFYPEAVLHIVADNIGKELLKNDPNIDKFFVFNRRTDSMIKQWTLVKQWRHEKYDVSFHLRSGIRNELLAFLSAIPVRIGFPLKGSFQFLTLKIKKETEVHHFQLGRLLLLPFHKVVPIYFPELFVDKYQKLNIEKLLQKNNLLPGKYVVIHPTGNSIKQENWQINFFNKLIDMITYEFKMPCIIIGSVNERKEIESRISTKVKPIFWFQNDINEVSELIRRSKFFCGNDSGPFHIAECWKIPSIVLYRDNPGNYRRWYPLNDEISVPIFHCELKIENLILDKVKITINRWFPDGRVNRI